MFEKWDLVLLFLSFDVCGCVIARKDQFEISSESFSNDSFSNSFQHTRSFCSMQINHGALKKNIDRSHFRRTIILSISLSMRQQNIAENRKYRQETILFFFKINLSGNESSWMKIFPCQWKKKNISNKPTMEIEKWKIAKREK